MRYGRGTISVTVAYGVRSLGAPRSGVDDDCARLTRVTFFRPPPLSSQDHSHPSGQACRALRVAPGRCRVRDAQNRESLNKAK